MTKISNPLNLPDDYLMAIGSAIASWADIEFILSLLIVKLSYMSKESAYGTIITTHMSFIQKIQSIKALLELWEAHGNIGMIQCAALKRAVKIADKLYIERNKIIHGTWRTDSSGKVKLSNITAKGSLKISNDYKNITDLDKLIRKIRKLHLKLFDACGAM